MSQVVHACVVAGGVETKYRAAGRGVVVVLLSDSELRRATMLSHVPLPLRLIVPELPAALARATGEAPHAAADLGEWLERFLDALGTIRAAVVVDIPPGARYAAVAMPDTSRLSVVLQDLSWLESDRGGNEGVAARLAVLAEFVAASGVSNERD